MIDIAKDSILALLAEHFEGVLNCLLSIHDEAIQRLPKVLTDIKMDEIPYHEETKKLICLLSNGKAPSCDAI